MLSLNISVRRAEGEGCSQPFTKNLKPVSVSDEDEIEILVVEGKIKDKAVRFINGYGPQDECNSPDEEKIAFFDRLDIEVKASKMAGTMTCIQMDANSKLGDKYIAGDDKPISKNGRLLAKVIDDNDLIVVNGTDKSDGVITRFRKTINGVEESVIDFFIVCRQFFNLINSLYIDEKRVFALTKFSDKKGNKSIKESDHNTMVLNLKASWSTNIQDKEDRTEIYNFQRTDDFERFVEETNDNNDLKNSFEDNNEEIDDACNNWLSVLNNLIKKCFKRIRVKKQKNNNELDKLFEEKRTLKTYLSTHEENDDLFDEKSLSLEKIIDDIADICGQKNKETVEEYLGTGDDGIDGFNQAKIWSLKKHLAPKNTEEPPMAKKDPKGNLVTDKC